MWTDTCNPARLRNATSEALLWLSDYRPYAILLVAAVFFTLTGSFDTFIIHGWGKRLLFWLPVLSLSFFAMVFFVALLRAITGISARAEIGFAFGVAIATAMIAAPVSRSWHAYLGGYELQATDYAKAYGHELPRQPVG